MGRVGAEFMLLMSSVCTSRVLSPPAQASQLGEVNARTLCVPSTPATFPCTPRGMLPSRAISTAMQVSQVFVRARPERTHNAARPDARATPTQQSTARATMIATRMPQRQSRFAGMQGDGQIFAGAACANTSAAFSPATAAATAAAAVPSAYGCSDVTVLNAPPDCRGPLRSEGCAVSDAVPSMAVGDAVPSIQGEAAAGGHAARHRQHCCTHCCTHHTRCTHCALHFAALCTLCTTPGRLTAVQVTKDQQRCAPTQRRASTHRAPATPPSCTWESSASSACGIVSTLRPANTLRCTPPACSSPAPRVHLACTSPVHLTALLACAVVTYKTELCAR